MGRGTRLSDEERGRIKGLHEAGLGLRAIARAVKRSTDAVQRVLDGGGSEARGGRPPLISDRALRLLVRTAARGQCSASQLKSELLLPCSVRTVRRVLQSVDWLCYSKMENTLQLSAEHKARRLAWAEEMVVRPDMWSSIVFSDEKKWNLDGPDGLQHYWRDLRQEVRQTNRRQMGGGSVMVWGGFAAAGKTKLAVLVGKQSSEHYVYTLSEYLLPFAHLHYGADFVFQQDNASIHTSTVAKEFFDEQAVRVLDWPARSPDLNPIENVWAIMSRDVYRNGTQYESVALLTAAVVAAWQRIPQDTLTTLISSMPRRCIEVIKKKGNKTHY